MSGMATAGSVYEKTWLSGSPVVIEKGRTVGEPPVLETVSRKSIVWPQGTVEASVKRNGVALTLDP